jgi:predicted enzyme related to lactoylglutathione lyase
VAARPAPAAATPPFPTTTPRPTRESQEPTITDDARATREGTAQPDLRRAGTDQHLDTLTGTLAPGTSNPAAHPVGSVCWIDLGVPDVDHAATFYSRLLGWTVAEPDETGYRLATLRGHLVAALGPATDPGRPYWTVYVHTADVAASTDAVIDAGGTVLVPPTPAGDAGVAAAVRDPHGGPLSLWQPGTHRGTHADSTAGSLAGVHLRTDQPDTTRAFLRAALAWHLHPDGRITCNGRAVATWAPSPTRPLPSPWLVSFHVSDATDATRRARALGATPTDEAPDILTDPSGALVHLSAPARRRPVGYGPGVTSPAS